MLDIDSYRKFIIASRLAYPTIGTDSGCVVISGPPEQIERRSGGKLKTPIRPIKSNSSTFKESLNRRLHWLGRESFPYGEPKHV